MTELLNTIMGGGVAAVSNLRERSFDLITATYGDGRSATLHILRGGAKAPFSVQAIGTGGQLRFEIGNVLFYRETMRRFLEMLQTGVQPIAYEDIYETIALLVAADQSARTGRSVRLAELVPYETPFSSVWRSHG